MLSSADNDFPDGNRLWLPEKDGIMIQENRPWRVRILEKETEETDKVETKQKQLSLSERRGFMLKSMIEERDKKDF